MQKTTWDGKPISPEPPFGASIVVYRKSVNGIEFLLLHRTHNGPDFKGDWAWTPPARARFPNEDLQTCALRELKEETGLELNIQKTDFGTNEWAVFIADAPVDCQVTLDAEHDRFEWMDVAKATKHCQPKSVANQIRQVVKALLRQGGK